MNKLSMDDKKRLDALEIILDDPFSHSAALSKAIEEGKITSNIYEECFKRRINEAVRINYESAQF